MNLKELKQLKTIKAIRHDKNFISELPLCEKLLPEDFIKNPGTYTEYKNTGLTQLKNNKKGNDYQLFINNSNNCIIALNKRYSDFIIENDLKIWSTKENCYTLVLSDYQKNIKGLICRCECIYAGKITM